MSVVFVYITTETRDEAETISARLVEERLAACTNIISPMLSLFHWNGAVEKETETVLIAKTTQNRFQALCDRVKKLHSYECPCVIALPVVAGSAEYLKWVEEEVSKPAG